MHRFAYYVSAHGFGHATRTNAIVHALFARAARLGVALEIELNSAVPPFVHRELVAHEGLQVRYVSCDVGLVQHDGVHVDHAATARALGAHLDGFDALVDREAEHLRSGGFTRVLADVPAAPLAAARRAGVPSAAIGNFDWAFIYGGYRDRDPAYARAIETFSAAYADTSLLLRLPFSPPMPLFPVREDVPIVVRGTRTEPAGVRAALGVRDGRPLVLISFGGLGAGRFGLGAFGERSVAAIDDVVFVAFGERSAETPANVLRIRDDFFHFPDLMCAADAVITKLGYGIVAEATAHHTAILYTPRPDFPEFPVMVRALPDHVPCAEVTVDELATGAFATKLRALIPKRSPVPRVRIDGAERVAAVLLPE